jgi:hypothetical protein
MRRDPGTMARPRATRNPAQKNRGPSRPNLSGFGLSRKPPIRPGLLGCFLFLNGICVATCDRCCFMMSSAAAEQQRASIVRPAPRSEAAVRKKRERRTKDGLPVQSLRCLLGDLATICRSTVRWRGSSATFERVTLPTDLQCRALELLGVSLEQAK